MNTQNKKKFIVSLFFILSFCFYASAQTDVNSASTWPYANETKQQRDARMQWWRNARFGMFIHWGLYSVPGGTYNGTQVKAASEWIMMRAQIPAQTYKQYAKDFNPVKYDPDAWVKLAKQAGMKYIVITSKHHEGFAMYDSKVTDWDIVDATPYGKDVLKPLAQACKKYGIKLGFYYSHAQDWIHPGGSAYGGHWDPAQMGDMTEYIKNIAVPQVKEILTNYGDISVLWWDTSIGMTKDRADLLQPLLNLQPGIITNNRLGGGYKGDLETPEQKIPATGLDGDWETCMPMNGSWGYKSFDDNWKSTETLLRNLVEIASKGGNYLLNVGPDSLGQIPQPSIDRLKEIGNWMDINGQSIYGTTASPFIQLNWGRCTKKIKKDGAVLYLHVFDWPADGKLIVPGLTNKIKKAYLLENKKSLATSLENQDVIVSVPQKALDPIDTVIVLEVKGDLKINQAMIEQAADSSPVQPENMVLVPAGRFAYQGNYDKMIYLDTFLIDKYEVTNDFYCQFLNNADPTGKHHDLSMEIKKLGTSGRYYYTVNPERQNHPVRFVSALDAQAFAEWRSSVFGGVYHLPTEQQWEKAAGWNPQIQHLYTYAFQKDDVDCDYSNYSSSCRKGPSPVGSFDGTAGKKDAKSYYGCYDMSGNVTEWTSSFWDKDNTGFQVVRGGFWAGSSNVQTGCQTTLRHFDAPSNRANYLGFRLVRDVE